MRFSKIIICTAVTSAILLLAACGDKKGTESSTSGTTVSSSVSSLAPVEVFFPDKYITLVGGEEKIIVKGNVAVSSDGKTSRRFDPFSREGEVLDFPLVFESGFGAGSDMTQFLTQFDLSRGYCLALGESGVVDISEIGTSAVSVTAVLVLGEDGQVSHISASRTENIKFAADSGDFSALAQSGIGNDFLIVTAESTDLKTVSSFSVSHYTF